MASLLQSRSKDDAVAGTTTTLAYSSSNTAGSTLVATVFWLATSGTCTVSDPTNGTWTAIGSPTVLTGTLSGQSFYVANTASSALTVTATISSSVSERGIAIHEYAGGYTLESHTETYNNSTSTPALTLTPNSSSDIAFTWIICGGHVNAVPSGFTLRENANFAGNGTADDLTPTGGSSLTATWTASNNTNILGLDIFTPTSGSATRMLLGVGS